MNRITAIKTYFEQDDKVSPGGGRRVEMAELKALTSEERDELGELCAVALGIELDGQKLEGKKAA